MSDGCDVDCAGRGTLPTAPGCKANEALMQNWAEKMTGERHRALIIAPGALGATSHGQRSRSTRTTRGPHARAAWPGGGICAERCPTSCLFTGKNANHRLKSRRRANRRPCHGLKGGGVPKVRQSARTNSAPARCGFPALWPLHTTHLAPPLLHGAEHYVTVRRRCAASSRCRPTSFRGLTGVVVFATRTCKAMSRGMTSMLSRLKLHTVSCRLLREG